MSGISVPTLRNVLDIDGNVVGTAEIKILDGEVLVTGVLVDKEFIERIQGGEVADISIAPSAGGNTK